MIFPIGDTQVVGGNKPIVSYGLIGINIIVFILLTGMEPEIYKSFLYHYGSIPALITRGENLPSLFISLFIHGSWFHLLGNMLFLWIFADNIEAILGSIVFIFLYLAGGMFGLIMHILFNVDSLQPTVGASGAISAIMGAYLIMFPRSQIKVLIVIFIVYMPAVVFLILWFAQQLLAGVSLLMYDDYGAGIAWWAHIGGFIFGIVMGFLYRNKVTEFNYKRLQNSSN